MTVLTRSVTRSKQVTWKQLLESRPRYKRHAIESGWQICPSLRPPKLSLCSVKTEFLMYCCHNRSLGKVLKYRKFNYSFPARTVFYFYLLRITSDDFTRQGRTSWRQRVITPGYTWSFLLQVILTLTLMIIDRQLHILLILTVIVTLTSTLRVFIFAWTVHLTKMMIIIKLSWNSTTSLFPKRNLTKF